MALSSRHDGASPRGLLDTLETSAEQLALASLHIQDTALEQERAAALSLRQWESALLDLGLQIGKDVLSTYLFAVERLAPLGPVMATLSRHDVRDQLQPRFRCWTRLAQRFGLGEAALYAHTLDPVLRRLAESYQTTRSFDVAELELDRRLDIVEADNSRRLFMCFGRLSIVVLEAGYPIEF